jgi:predicted nucleic acid-binding protein
MLLMPVRIIANGYSGADTIVSSDDDLLVLHRWRGIHIQRPAEYLAS